MPGINPTKELYMAKSIEELQKYKKVNRVMVVWNAINV